MQPYYILYKNLVISADELLMHPSYIKNEVENNVADIERFGNHLLKSLPRLKAYPLLTESVFSLLEHNDLTGYLGEFIIDEAIDNCDLFREKEETVLSQIEKIKESSSTIQQNILDDIHSKVQSWRRIITLDNMEYIKRLLDALQKQTDDIYESLSAEEKLGKALALSEKERKRLLAQEEARRRGISEKEFEKEEKRRQAQKEYSKRIKIRKKNNHG